MQIHREGTGTILIALALSGSLLFGIWKWSLLPPPLQVGLSAVVVLLLLIVVYFFREPERRPPGTQGLVLAPADGRVVAIERVKEGEYLGDERIQVSIFMSPLNVHVNWYPVAGEVSYFKYHPGRYLVAWHPKSSTDNERTTVVVRTPEHGEVLFRQIAGALARRICTYSRPGDEVGAGTEFGFIKFGSRVDVFLPLHAQVSVGIGDRVQGARSVIAEFPSG